MSTMLQITLLVAAMVFGMIMINRSHDKEEKRKAIEHKKAEEEEARKKAEEDARLVEYNRTHLQVPIAGLNFCKDIARYVGSIDAVLVEEPENVHDPHAIRIESFYDGHKLGYVQRDHTDTVRNFLAGRTFPFECTSVIDSEKDEIDGHTYHHGFIYLELV